MYLQSLRPLHLSYQTLAKIKSFIYNLMEISFYKQAQAGRVCLLEGVNLAQYL